MTRLKIIFFGTPEFAVPSLQAISEEFDLLAVVTAPDKPAGRGHNLLSSDVKKWAVEHQIRVLQPANLKSNKFLGELRALGADLFAVVAFRMLPEQVWNMPRLGSVNLHASLLPDYRGAAPIQRAIMSGETETGVTCFRLKHQIDTGDIILQKKIAILPEDDGGSLHDKLMTEGARLLVESISLLSRDDFKPAPQKESSSKTAPKIHSEDLLIHWEKTAKEIHDLIRAFSPYPGARTTIDGVNYKIFKSRIVSEKHDNKPGEWIIDMKAREVMIACGQGMIRVLELQPESKRRMNAEEFVNGLRNK